MPSRQTVARPAEVCGTALHTGRAARVTFLPAAAGTGIVFRRLDRDEPPIPALVEHVTATDRRTALGGERGVQTVEHVLAAVYAAGLDDLEVGVLGPEPPIADGSALPFLEALQRAGTTTLPGTSGRVRLHTALSVTQGNARYVLRPSTNPRLTVTIDFDHPLIGSQSGSWDLTPTRAAVELVPARTFGFLRDAEALHAQDLGQGATPESVLILTDTGLRGGPLRWPDEFVRHKALDLLGDLMLAGAPVAAHITAIRPSHAGNVAVARALRH